MRFTSLRGAQLEFSYGETPRVNGAAIDYENWPLFEGPFMHAEKGSRRLELRFGKQLRVLDFTTLTITDAVEE